ncbi:hypothetical protein A3A93_05290 [Candidatus Roizmanbacteria bacterium RIFCSPLOWO2_01_FULL_38_12]|uniref:Prepilin peptidase n=1 Tax=Candidatus Roizmanbacteria bacterium RIFCSPLOWO2_01_FULL_38_12 TaxID=1802061 RepID=A0A1F7IZ30_9BACT|nr:MAG: hypothetical protein A2861_03505 [Candidatus Roizmanbacteria bacterium RIFCSPHIGHO2_01_FULL_38_15]OGK48607.1 MAG: hypothetical protein A3A93_05290 [Candidatus Roizmanbacteria bacterium RIFCSPLOWO2_01_FULL_38_12]
MLQINSSIFYILYSIFLFIIGLFLGSFLNVVADRLACEQTLGGRSKCDTCKRKLSWIDLIPIISYTSLKGKCRYCQASISIQYPISEIATGVVFTLTWILSQNAYPSASVWLHFVHIAIASLIFVIILTDLRYQIIPDEIHIALIIVGILRFLLLNSPVQTSLFFSLLNFMLIQKFGMMLVAGMAVMLPLLLIFLITKGKGMGFGDVKFAYIIGFLLGIKAGLIALYIGFVIGGIIALFLMILQKAKLKTKIAFGPFLIIGFYIMLFFQMDLYSFINSIYGF